MIRRISQTLIVLVTGLFAAPALGQSSIELRPTARVAPDAAVTLADVAHLEGPDAVALGPTVLIEAADRPGAGGSLSLADLRKALEARARVNWGRIALRGSTCSLVAVSAPAPPRKIEPQGPAPAEPAPLTAGTVRAAVLARVAQILRAEPDELKPEFEAGDAAILDLSAAGRTLEIRPTGSSDRLPLSITVYEGDRVVASRTIRVGVQVRRTVVVAMAAKRRGEVIGPADVTTETRWLPASAKPAALEQVVGTEARSRINAGQALMADDAAPVMAAGKGEVVAVRCISGSLVLSTRGRTMAAARDGEVVQLQALDSKRTFYARMDGRGRAILTAGPEPEAAEGRSASGSLPVRGDRVPPPALSALELTR